MKFKLPNNIFKYYQYDERYNKSRLAGDVYLASPLDFNDLYDCQQKIENNFKVMRRDDSWLKSKLTEIDIPESKIDEYVIEVNKGNKVRQEILEEIRTKQLEKFGVFCTTSNANNELLWGYYTNNTGFCIEYSKELIIKRIILGFVNVLSWETTAFLCNEKGYKKRKIMDKDYVYSFRFFDKEDSSNTKNRYLLERCDEDERSIFFQNILVKRFVAKNVRYQKRKIKKAQLFFNKNSGDVNFKYYTKKKKWRMEDEFRFSLSLGGRKVINLGFDCIKSIRFGCNMSYKQIFEIISVLPLEKDHKIKLFKMVKGPSGFKECSLSLDNLTRYHNLFKGIIDECK